MDTKDIDLMMGEGFSLKIKNKIERHIALIHQDLTVRILEASNLSVKQAEELAKLIEDNCNKGEFAPTDESIIRLFDEAIKNVLDETDTLKKLGLR